MSLRDLALYCSDVTLLTQQTVTPRVRSGPSGSCLVRLQPHRRAGLLYPTIYGRSDPHVSMTVRIYVRLQRLKIWCRCKEFASRRRLFLINIGTACSLYTLGDLLQQKIERQKRIDWKRTVRMATMGLACLGPLNHNWYIFLDKMLPGTTVRIVTKKVLVDMLVMGPIFLVSFYSGKCVIKPPVYWEAKLFFCTHTHTHTLTHTHTHTHRDVLVRRERQIRHCCRAAGKILAHLQGILATQEGGVIYL